MHLEHHQPDDNPWAHLPKGLLASGEPTLHPRLRLHRGFPSHYLPDKRDLIVYLPPGYDEQPERSYPVLYLQDGQNLFDVCQSMNDDEWRVDEALTALIGVPLFLILLRRERRVTF